jgi:copper chaperone CopZ
MTQLEALYRYEGHPTETAMFALGNLREVYGIRRIKVDEELKTVRVEYDATRLTSPTIFQLLRQTGLVVVEELPLIPVAEAVPASAEPTK